MEHNQETPKRRYLGALWILATETGWIVGMGITVLLGEVINPLTQGAVRALGWGIMGMFVGMIIGINQWLIVKNVAIGHVRPGPNRWILGTIFGWGIGLGIVIGLGAGDQFGFALSGAIIGLAVGVVQMAFILPSLWKALEWIGFNTIGWLAGLALIDLLDDNIGFILAGVVAGLITGVGMLLRYQPADPGEPG